MIGKVKTRLQPVISKELSLKIHTAFAADTIIKINAVRGIKKYLFYDLKEGDNIIKNLVSNSNFEVCLQTGKDLGEKMQNAICRVMKDNIGKVIIVGTDSPTLPSEYINQAFLMLDKKDIVIGPSTDDGYYLIGMRGYPFKIFDGIEWGTNKVIKQTMTGIRRQQLHTGVLPPWYDVDTIEDINYLKDHMRLLRLSGDPVPENTYRCLIEN